MSNLSVALEQFVSEFWMIHNNLLLSHIVNSLVSVTLNRVVVLVDLYSQASAGGEVIRLGQVAKTMVLHGLNST